MEIIENRIPLENHENHEIIELHTRITKIMEMLEFHLRIMRIMKIIEFHSFIMKTEKTIIPLEKN